MRGQLCETATPTPCWAACSRREARRWSWRALRCRAGQRGPPPLARPVCRRAAGSVTLAGPQSQTTATSHGVRSGSVARLVALSRGAAQVAGEPALTGQGSELWRCQDGSSYVSRRLGAGEVLCNECRHELRLIVPGGGGGENGARVGAKWGARVGATVGAKVTCSQLVSGLEPGQRSSGAWSHSIFSA